MRKYALKQDLNAGCCKTIVSSPFLYKIVHKHFSSNYFERFYLLNPKITVHWFLEHNQIVVPFYNQTLSNVSGEEGLISIYFKHFFLFAKSPSWFSALKHIFKFLFTKKYFMCECFQVATQILTECVASTLLVLCSTFVCNQVKRH